MSTILVSHSSKVVKGEVQLPSSKSISNRLLLMRAVSGFQNLEIRNLSNARDTQILNGILSGLEKGNQADAHDAGTVMRFLTAYLSAREGEWLLTGSERMKQRPIGPLVDVLRKLGAEIKYTEKENYPSLQIKGRKLKGGAIEIDGSVSSQFLSALLMIAPLYKEPLQLHIRNKLVSVPYVEMTLKLMEQWGIQYTWKENCITVSNSAYKKPSAEIFVESDWSAASYFYSILFMAQSGELTMPHLSANSLQGDSICAGLFSRLGIFSEYKDNNVTIKKTGNAPENFSYDFIQCPDLAQTFAVCCAAKGIGMELTGLETLTIKETDRITALQNELAKIGVEVNVTPFSLVSRPSSLVPRPSFIPSFSTYKDHRMAMSLASLALQLDKIEIKDPLVVEKSFPHFWDELKKTGFTIEE
jgi:3-phosphoshikimate 1-carboxyvinyltransferase